MNIQKIENFKTFGLALAKEVGDDVFTHDIKRAIKRIDKKLPKAEQGKAKARVCVINGLLDVLDEVENQIAFFCDDKRTKRKLHKFIKVTAKAAVAVGYDFDDPYA